MVAIVLGGISGCILWGRLSETKLGRRGAATFAAAIAVVMIPLYLMTKQPALHVMGALLMGLSGNGMWGVIPSYLAERFPTAVRSVGPGVAYHAGAGIGSVIPILIGTLHDRGMALNKAMGLCIGIASFLAIALVWLGPETRGRRFDAIDDESAA